MLNLYRRHLSTCDHKAKGQGFSLCECPLWVYGDAGGAKVRVSLHTNNLDHARVQMDLLESRPVSVKGITLAAAAADYLNDCRARKLAKGTVDSYTRTLGHLMKFYQGPVKALTVAKLAEFRDSRKVFNRKGEVIGAVSSRTQRKEIEQLRGFFDFCMERVPEMPPNPAKKLKYPQDDSEPTLPFTRDEVLSLLAACDSFGLDNPSADNAEFGRLRARALVLLLVYSGLRISDVAALRRSKLTGTKLLLRQAKTKMPVYLNLHPDAVAALRRLPASNPVYFFWNGEGGSKITTCKGKLSRVIERLGKITDIHAHPHRFRDTFAVEMLTKGASLREVQLLLGHTSIKTTEKHYAPFVAAHQALLDRAVGLLDFRPAAAQLVPVRKNRRGN